MKVIARQCANLPWTGCINHRSLCNKSQLQTVHYLSIEYLIGRSLETIPQFGLFDILKIPKSTAGLGNLLEEIFDTEYDPARQTAVWDDWRPVILIRWFRLPFPVSVTASTTNTVCLKQKIDNGYQAEMAD